MMISSKESCGTDLPSTAGTRRNTMFSRGYYNPPYQISGQHYMAGTIAPTGPSPVALDPANPDEIFFGKMNIRESPSMSGVKTGKTTEVNHYYKVKAKSWGSLTNPSEMKIGERDQKWALIAEGDKELGWACIAETIKIAEPAQQIVVSYANAVPTDSNLTEEELKNRIAEKKIQIAAVNKWLEANAPKSSGGSKSKTATTKAGSEDTSSGLSTTSMVLIGLGAAALVYFLIQKGKK